MNKEEIDKWLDNEYGVSYTRLEELHDFYFEKYCDLKEENKHLKEHIEKYEHYCKTTGIEELMQENEKLHHYKTLYQSLKKQKEELRDWLKEDKDKIKVYDTKNNNAVELGIIIGLGMCVEKIEELEGVSNE